jgi:hypothetical protein
VLTFVISSVPTWLGDTADVGEAVAGIAALIGLFVLAFQVSHLAVQTKYQGDQTKNQADQIKYQGDAIRASVIQGITTQMLTIDQVFVEYPQLWPFFYEDSVPFPKDHPEYRRALSAAEMFVDLIDCVVSLKDHMRADIDLPGWNKYANELYEQSFPLRAFVEKHEDWYETDTIEYFKFPP